jgi:hypothetical protein
LKKEISLSSNTKSSKSLAKHRLQTTQNSCLYRPVFNLEKSKFMRKILTLTFTLLSSILRSQDYGAILSNSYEIDRNVVYQDRVYHPKIRSVMFYADENMAGSFPGSAPAVVKLGDPRRLILSFDELGDMAHNYSVRIIHCNFDWSVSSYSYLEYLSGFNEIQINSFEFSSATKVLYTHYHVEIPKVKLSGNYLAEVFDRDEGHTILTRRFVVFEPATRIFAEYRMPIGTQESRELQQIDVEISHPGIDFFSPSENVKLLIRQNYRWDNAKVLKPLFVKAADRILDYRYFDLTNAFEGGNEFRVVDLSDFESNTIGVADRRLENTINTLVLFPEHLWGNMNYSGLIEDLNGRFVPNRRRFLRPDTEADYTQTIFTLLADQPLASDVYVLGSFNHYHPSPESKMLYIPSQKRYTANLLLKQGYYNYFYATVENGKINTKQTENSFELTENEYDILVYYKPFGGRGDRVVGYTQLRVHLRR